MGRSRARDRTPGVPTACRRPVIDLMTTTVQPAGHSSARPGASELYWVSRAVDFDGRTWTQSRWLRNLPPAPTIPATARYDYEMELEPTDRRQLVALELPTSAPRDAQLSLDYGLYAPRPLSSLTRWRMQSAPPARFEPELKSTLRRLALQLPAGFNPRTLALARQWRREAGAANDRRIVDRAWRGIGAEFAYTRETPLLGRNSVDEFRSSRKPVLRALQFGIRGADAGRRDSGPGGPRLCRWIIAIRSGLLAGASVPTRTPGPSLVTGRGWVRVDPTAAVAPERSTTTLSPILRAPGAFGAFGGFTPILNVGDWLRRGWNDFVLGFDATRQRQLLEPFGIDEIDTNRLLLLFFLIAGLALGGMLWLITRNERERDPVLRAWRRLEARYRRLGLVREPHEPALAWSRRVAAQRPGHEPESSRAFRRLALRSRSGRRAAARDLIRDCVRIALEPTSPGFRLFWRSTMTFRFFATAASLPCSQPALRNPSRCKANSSRSRRAMPPNATAAARSCAGAGASCRPSRWKIAPVSR